MPPVNLATCKPGAAFGRRARRLLAFTALLLAAANAAADPALALRVQGNRLVDAKGQAVRLRGASYSGFEFAAIQGWSPSDPSGAQAGHPGGPDWAAMRTWRANAVRLPLNEASWLGYRCTDATGVARNPDPGGNYRAAVKAQVAQANAAGLYVILDLHWAAPAASCPMLQTQMADADHAIAFWQSVAGEFKNAPAVAFELYNEPYLDGLSMLDSPWHALTRGGTLRYYSAAGANGAQRRVESSWRSAGMQAMVEAVRGAGAANVVLVGGLAYCNDLSGWLENMPADPLGQLAAAWHPYPPVQFVRSAAVAAAGQGYAVGDTITLPRPDTVYSPAVFGVTATGSGGAVRGVGIVDGGAYLQTRLPDGAVPQARSSGSGRGAAFSLGFANKSSTWSMPANWPAVARISARVPLVITETGEHNERGTAGSPFLQELLPYADAHGWSVIGWGWNVWGAADNVLISDGAGTPTDGYGRVFHDWISGAP